MLALVNDSRDGALTRCAVRYGTLVVRVVDSVTTIDVAACAGVGVTTRGAGVLRTLAAGSVSRRVHTIDNVARSVTTSRIAGLVKAASTAGVYESVMSMWRHDTRIANLLAAVLSIPSSLALTTSPPYEGPTAPEYALPPAPLPSPSPP